MADEKVTIMKLKVDLQCSKCYKKVKKVLCKFPQIRDQDYDEKQGIVTIKVVCCNPEKLRDKLCCKGGGSIKSIEIVDPQCTAAVKAAANAAASAAAAAASATTATTAATTATTAATNATTAATTATTAAKTATTAATTATDAAATATAAAAAPPRVCYLFPQPIGTCCKSCYEGRLGGPCFQGYGGGRPCCVSRFDQYLSEENPQGCTVM